ncbi:unnamed protein product [Microthlaspi erraticum]|uniref:Uncharacterized protein n=1 Tax=Microthlaspi erraticum TaxID=1685480 RepID=A0A6D2HG66_9BRAS|nr:unnamed protein product [Microthlaspi erraticum]
MIGNRRYLCSLGSDADASMVNSTGFTVGSIRFPEQTGSPVSTVLKTPSHDTDAFTPTPAGSTTSPALSRSKDSTVSVRLRPIRDIVNCYFGLRAPLFPAGSLQFRFLHCIYGYTAYSASKFGLQGLAQALQQEVISDDIHVTLLFPPDTDTPGSEQEQKKRPKLT